MLGWKPEISFEEMVREMIHHDMNLARKDKLCNDHGVDVYKYHEQEEGLTADAEGAESRKSFLFSTERVENKKASALLEKPQRSQRLCGENLLCIYLHFCDGVFL